MGIRVISEIPNENEQNVRMETLKEEIREIIYSKIPLCELTNNPYPDSTMRSHLKKAMRIVLWEISREKGIVHCSSDYEVFKIISKKADLPTVISAKDRPVRWYVKFDVKKWEESMND